MTKRLAHQAAVAIGPRHIAREWVCADDALRRAQRNATAAIPADATPALDLPLLSRNMPCLPIVELT